MALLQYISLGWLCVMAMGVYFWWFDIDPDDLSIGGYMLLITLFLLAGFGKDIYIFR